MDIELIKINKNHLDKINSLDNVLNYFGNWINNIDDLREKFINAEPFEHIIIDNFLNEKYANQLHERFPNNFDNWYKYDNPIEVKYTYDKINNLDEKINNYFYYLSSNKLIDIFRKLTNIADLTNDEYLHGAGLHCHPRHGKLNIHLDYEKHPLTGKERRLNVIYFLNKDWKKEWNGQNELWDENAEKCIAKTDIVFNRAIIFKTNDITWHGLPEKILCPQDEYRKSFAYYYVSPLRTIKNENEYRKKAKYISINKKDDKLVKLCEIRKNRRLTEDDINTYCPNWSKEK